MRKVKAKTAALLEAIRKNYEAHKAAYAEAFDGYKIEAAEAMQKAQKWFGAALHELSNRVQGADRARGQKPVPLYLDPNGITFTLSPPVDHSSDYEVVIRMLEFETSPEVEIDADQFECYVMDRWAWKEDFLASHEAYSNRLRAPGR